MGLASGHNAGSERTARDAAAQIVRVLQDAGYVAYFAGGCVRDMLLGQDAADYDVATDAHPEQVLEQFRSARLVGEAFGVALVRMYRHDVEVATFRIESGYVDGRHPDHVAYSDAEHDAQRRDFTINGMFYDPVADAVHDYVSGQLDLERKVIRAIGDPGQRFADDYLRLLRAVRFSARLRFEIEAATAAAIEAHASMLDRISRERIGMEIEMMMSNASRARAAEMLQRFGLDGPTLNESTLAGDLACLSALDDSADYPSALAGWLVDRHLCPGEASDVAGLIDALRGMKSVQLARRWRAALVLSNEQRQALAGLLKQLPVALDWENLNVAQRKRLLARDDWAALHGLRRAVERRQGGPRRDEAAMERQIESLVAEGVAPAPLLSGHDLINAGFEPGPAFKRLLEQVYDAQLMGEVRDVAAATALARKLAGGGD
ncbi:MAG: metal-dependent phosphohydrolase [Planctomycetaceae bacterium]|nr:metal-dependent phosphohydrolase [Planctomycetaceae bacterium]